MISRIKLHGYLNELLEIDKYQDYCPNGLQIEGVENINKIVTGVTASNALIERAVQLNADAILVHHGYFWKGEPPSITGIKKNRISNLIKNDINLFAYHLPLDFHSEYGNNVQLVQQLGAMIVNKPVHLESFSGVFFEFVPSVSGEQLKNQLDAALEYHGLHISVDRPIKRVALCTGAAQDYLDLFEAEDIDAYISGEISERTVHVAREKGIHYFAAGHHATEKGGVKALGQHLERKFGIDVEFVDLPIPV